MSEKANPADDRTDGIGRRAFAVSAAGVLGLSAMLPLSGLGAGAARGSANRPTVLGESRTPLPGGGERTTNTMAHDMFGFKGETTVIQDLWPTDEGTVSHIYFTTSPAMEVATGDTVRQGQIKRTTVFGSDIDDEYRHVTITNEVTAPGQATVVTEWKAKQRIRMIEPTDEELEAGLDQLYDEHTQGTIPAKESPRIIALTNTIDLEQVG